MKWYLETEDLLVPEQAGFLQFRRTDQAPYLYQKTEDAFQEQKLVLVSCIDLQKAFDKVWVEGLLVKLLRNGITSNLFHWIKSFLYNCRASLCRQSSRKDNSTEALCFTGRSLSPTLFLLFINDLVSELPKGINVAKCADN